MNHRKLFYNPISREFVAAPVGKRCKANGNWSLIANRVSVDVIAAFLDNAKIVFTDHVNYYPDAQAVRYALIMWQTHKS